MKPGKYVLKELFLNKNIEQIIIPEIQRDYVWGKIQVESLLSSITTDFKIFNEKELEEINCITDETIKFMFTEYYKKQKFSSNIGFIYAYNDTSYKDKYFLIDGQQRLTTVYILIFALYNILDKNEEFNKKYFVDKKLKIDYKVRDSSHDFLVDFISNVRKDFNINTIKDEYWYFSKYDSDSTIQSVKNNYKIIIDFLIKENINIKKFKDYVENYVEFWFFDTNISKQGEELYLSMNSRGEAMQSNENLKALLLNKLPNNTQKEKKVKCSNGQKWEQWQHFFWINRDDNENADIGFNRFIKWIVIIEYFTQDDLPEQNEKDKNKKIEEIVKDNQFISYLEILSMDKIEKYYKTLCVLIEWKFIKTEYFNKKIQTEPLDILPILYIKSKTDFEELDYKRHYEFFKNINRFTNPTLTFIVRSLDMLKNKGIPKDIIEFNKINDKNYERILTEQERTKLTILENHPKQREEIEKVFWEFDGHKLLKGDFSFVWELTNKENFDFKEFKDYKDLFFENFTKITNERRRALLTFGDYGIFDGWTYGKPRYSFEITPKEWNNREKSKKLKECTIELLKELKEDQSIKDITETYKDEDKGWIYYFVHCNNILEDASKSRITWDSNKEKPINILYGNNAQSGLKNYDEYVKKCDS